MKKSVLKIIRISRGLFFLSFILLAILLILTNNQLPTSIKLLSVQSGSMSPVIKAGDLIISQPKTGGDYQAPEILVFRDSGGNLITHRLVAETAEGFKTKGDANNTEDTEILKKEQILGRVIQRIPYLGLFTNFVKTTTGFVLLIVIPSFYIIFSELITIRDEILKVKREGAPPTILPCLFLLLLTSSFMLTATYSAFNLSRENSGNVFAASNLFSSVFASSTYSCTQGAEEQEGIFGNTTFELSASSVFFKINLREASPSTTYDVSLQQEAGDCYHSTPNFPAGITTDTEGNASNSFVIDRLPSANQFWVELTQENQILRSTAVVDQ